jgi:hypothetical protein
MKKKMGRARRTFWILFVTLFVCSILYWVISGQSVFNNLYSSTDLNNQTASVSKAFPVVEQVPDYVVITFAGDVMFDRGVKGSVKKNFKGDYNQLFDNINGENNDESIFNKDDISFVNLEGPVSDVGHNVGSIYSFRMDPVVISVLKNLGIDIVSFANNHVGDYSSVAFADTLKRLNNGSMPFTGAGNNYTEAIRPTVIEKNNIKTCFLGFSDVGPNWIKATDKNPGLLIANDPNFSKIISEAKIDCDVLIVSFHWGDEYKPHNIRQEKLAHSAIDSGADIVVGAHPHVAQDVEIYKERPIMYSLGNFMFDQYFSKETLQGLVVQMKVYKDGSTSDIKQYTSQQNKLFQIESITEKTEI